MTLRLLDPLPLSLGVFGSQAVLWWLLMPEIPTVVGASPRFVSSGAILHYVVFLGVWVLAITFAKALGRDIARQKLDWMETPRLDLSYIERVAIMALPLTALGEFVYAREILHNPGLVL